MAEGPEQKDGAALPPKLDLRKHAVSSPDSEAEEKPSGEEESPKIKLPGMSDLTAPPEPAAPSSTIRIKMPEEAEDGAPARRLTLSQPGDAAPGVPKPAVPKPAVPKPAAKPAVPVTSKKETSKIPLSAAKPAPDADAPGAPKTIRIKPRTTAPTTQAKKPVVPATGSAPGADAEPTAAAKEAAKRQTSRISLESALDSDSDDAAEAPAPSAPKTIRLKRPSEAATVKMKPRPDADDDSAGKAKLGETARLDDLPIEEEGPTATRRRTIKVKRPTQRATVSLGGPTGAPAAGGDADEEEPSTGATLPMYAQQHMLDAPPQDGAHWFFIMCACLAVVAGLTLVYIFSAQTFGPNSSGTRLSYAPSGPSLSWFGKVGN